MGGTGSFGRALGGINLPGTGVVREIGNEFAMATKQVLLFGTAYKALAFITSFPSQVGQAVGALQSFRNTLKTIAPTAEEVQASNQFILDTVDRYNVPLESARTGFTRLYASMAPAGFKGDEIRELFLGISKTSATLGLGADQVDRVTYAFGQMASKGQFMAEEVTGQLGDVIPGALSIMAEAAGMGIKEFKKAMEDGAFVGTEFTRVMNNVPKVLEKEFGKGAEGAAKTFQGLINRMQNSTRLLYEAFEPVAVGFLNSVVVPLTSGIKTITDGLNAFFTGTQAKTAGGMAFAQELERLRPTFEGLQANITALIPSFQLFGSVLLNAAKFLATVAGNPITGFLLKVYANVLLVNTAFTLLGGKILAGLIANIGLATSRFIAMNAAVFALQRTSAVTNSTLAGTQLQMMLLQRNATGAIGPVNALLGSLLRMAGIGAIAIGITIIVNGLTQLKDAEARIARLRGEKDPVGPAGPRPIATAGRRYTGATREKVTADQQKQIEYVARLRNELKSLEATQTKAGSALSQTAVGGLSNLLGGFKEENTTARITELKLLIQNAEEVINLDPNKFRTAAEQQRVAAMATIGGGGGAGAGAGGKPSKERESQIPLLKLELEYSKELFALNSEIFSAQLGGNTLLTTRLEGEKELLDLRYEQLKVDLEQIPAEEKRLKVLAINQRADLARLKTRTAMEEEVTKSIDEQQKAIEAMQSASQLELNNKKTYADLLQKGIAPAQAKILIEVDNEINKIKSALELTQKRVQAEIDVLKALKAQGKAIDEGLLTKLEGQYGETGEAIGALPGLATEETAKRFALAAPKTATEYLAEGLKAAQDNFEELTNIGNQSVMIANSIGDAFGTAFKGIITGSMTAQQALAGMFQSIADSFADMVSKMIAEWLKAQLIQGFMNIFGSVAGGIGTGLSSGFSAGTSSAIDTSSAGWGAAFNTPLKFANGGIVSGGFRAFANGGVVSGPTLGLVGEGRYNEAVVPLPDGKSIPVSLGGAAGSNISTNIVVNMGNGQGGGGQATGAQGNQLARELEGAVRQVILKESRPGGIIYSR
jgi:tape measure domain-containing protein